MLHVPLLAHPLGWLVLGAGGYALYRAGKKQARQEAAAVPPTTPALADTASTKGKEEH